MYLFDPLIHSSPFCTLLYVLECWLAGTDHSNMFLYLILFYWVLVTNLSPCHLKPRLVTDRLYYPLCPPHPHIFVNNFWLNKSSLNYSISRVCVFLPGMLTYAFPDERVPLQLPGGTKQLKWTWLQIVPLVSIQTSIMGHIILVMFFNQVLGVTLWPGLAARS